MVRPKVNGAWNLHNTLLDHKLDFFIMLSSVSGVIGNRGQAAYAAANSFLDEFAHYRVSKGFPATSIDLGVVKEIGFVAERPELQASLESLSGDAVLNETDVLALYVHFGVVRPCLALKISYKICSGRKRRRFCLPESILQLHFPLE